MSTHVDRVQRVKFLKVLVTGGADSSVEIGEDPNDTPNNLMLFISQVAAGGRDYLKIFGKDYDTVDGTGVRDYIHVVDLALAHVAAVDYVQESALLEAINIGTGNGISVLQMVSEFEQQSSKKVNYQIVPRRPSDAAEVWADISKARRMIGFQARFGATKICRDTWRWQSANPDGYQNR